MTRRTEITLTVFGLLIACIMLVFGDNLFQQITGRSFFEKYPLAITSSVITVTPKPNSTSAPFPELTSSAILTRVPTLISHSHGTLDIPQSWTVDLDNGVIGDVDDKVDIWFHAVTASERYIEPGNGAKIAVLGTTPPGLSGCKTAPLSQNRINVDDLSIGVYICVLTSEHRYSQLQLKTAIGSSPGTFSVDYITW